MTERTRAHQRNNMLGNHFPFCRTMMLIMAMASAAVAQDNTPSNSGPTQARQRPQIVVHGNGTVAANPDQANIQLGIEKQADTAAAAQTQANAVMNKILKTVTALGIERQSVRTASLQLSPVYSNPSRSSMSSDSTPKISGFRADNTIQIEVNQLDRIGQFVDAAIKAGANRLEGVSFSLKNDLSARTEALRQAVTEARIKAKVIAEAEGLNLGDVIEVVENNAGVVQPQHGVVRAMALQATTPVEAGQLHVEASVTVRYRIKVPGTNRQAGSER